MDIQSQNGKPEKQKKQNQQNINGKFQDTSSQTEVFQRDYIPTSVLTTLDLEIETNNNFINRPHSIIGLIIFMIIFIYCKLYNNFHQGENSIMLNGHTGLFFSFLMLVVYAAIYFPDTILQRPHPVFWRLVHACGMAWLLAITFINFYSKEELQKFLQVAVDTDLGIPLKERSYGENCEFYTPGNPNGNFSNITGAIDIFFAAHITGWAFKMLVTRDFKVCMMQSILFELLELSFRHWLNNFYECWWDSIILDIILCNTTGMLIGLFIINQFKLKKYKWSMRKKNDKSYFQNLKEIILPSNLVEHHWEILSSTKRFLAVTFMIIFSQMIEISFFFNKFVLHIETGHPICAFRIFLIGFLGMPAMREYYEFITDSNVKRLGSYCWNMFGILIMETSLFITNADWNHFNTPFPWYVKLIWGVVLFIYLTLLSFLIYNDIKKKLKEYKINQINNKIKQSQ